MTCYWSYQSRSVSKNNRTQSPGLGRGRVTTVRPRAAFVIHPIGHNRTGSLRPIREPLRRPSRGPVLIELRGSTEQRGVRFLAIKRTDILLAIIAYAEQTIVKGHRFTPDLKGGRQIPLSANEGPPHRHIEHLA